MYINSQENGIQSKFCTNKMSVYNLLQQSTLEHCTLFHSTPTPTHPKNNTKTLILHHMKYLNTGWARKKYNFFNNQLHKPPFQ
jgi:hypothetical protein